MPSSARACREQPRRIVAGHPSSMPNARPPHQLYGSGGNSSTTGCQPGAGDLCRAIRVLWHILSTYVGGGGDPNDTASSPLGGFGFGSSTTALIFQTSSHIVSSGAQRQSGCNCGTNHHFHTQNQAATAALKAIFPTSEDQLAEYGGRIYMNPDGKTYSYTTPVTQGQNGSVDPDAGQGMGNRLPAGTTSAGEYHTHPDTLAHCCAQNGFSGPDGERAVNQHIPTYIMTPAGTVFKLDGTHSNNYMTAPQSSWSANGPIP